MPKTITVLILVIAPQFSWAEPYFPRVVNDATRQCGMINLSMGCIPPICHTSHEPAGWRVIQNEEHNGILRPANCPKNYRDVGEINPVVVTNNSNECCSDDYEFADFSDDCGDLIRNPATRQCAFLEDSCLIPKGWQRKPTAWIHTAAPALTRYTRWKCPTQSGWKWVAIQCK